MALCRESLMRIGLYGIGVLYGCVVIGTLNFAFFEACVRKRQVCYVYPMPDDLNFLHLHKPIAQVPSQRHDV